MSETNTRSRSSNQVTEPVAPPKDSKSRRFLNAFARGRAGSKRKRQAIGESVEKTVEQVSNYVNYVLSETDYLRRRERFDGLVAENRDDARLADAIKAADKWTTTINGAVANKKSTWTIRATMCTVATEDLLAGMKLARDGERKAARNYPAIDGGLKTAKTALDNAKQHLTPDQLGGFLKDLNGLQVELGKLPPAKKGDKPPPLGAKVTTLQESIAQAITSNAERQNQLRSKLEPLRARLSGATGGTPDETGGGDPRLVVGQLLSKADNAIYAFDFDTAETALEEAGTALDEMKAPQTSELPSPKDLLDGIGVMKRQTGGLNTRAEKLPDPAKTALKDRIQSTLGRLEAMEFALAKGGQSVIADANRVTESCVDALVEIDQTIKDFGAFKQGQDAAGIEFTKLHRRVQGQAQSYYQKLGLTGGGDGAFQTRLADIAERWSQSMASAISLKDLGKDAYLNELNALSEEILGSTADPGMIAVEKATSRYRTALAALRTEAERVTNVDSDQAIKLGLTTKPATLQNAGDGLVGPKGGKLAPAERVTQIDAVTKKIEELTAAAREFDDTKLAFEIDQLRKTCETLIEEHRRKVNAVLNAVDVERKKLISIGTSKSGRDDLTAYGKSLLQTIESIIAPLDGLKPGVAVDAGLLGDAHHDLVGLRTRIADYESLGPKGKTDKSLPSFDSLEKRAEGLKKTVEEHSLLTPRGELTAPWLEQLDGIVGHVTGRDPRQTDAELVKLKTEIDQALVQAGIESKQAGEQSLRLENLAADVVLGRNGTAVLGEDTPTYQKDLDRRLRKLASDIKLADKPSPETQKLVNEVAAAIKTNSSGIAARGTGEKDAKTAQAEYEAAQFGLERLNEVELELLEEKAGRMSGEARKLLLKQAKDLRDQVDSSIKALELTRDVAAAKTMADAIAERITRIAEAPLGSTTRARNNLPAVDRRWVAAVELLHRRIEAIPGQVKQSCTGDTAAETAADAVTAKLVDPVKALFRGDAFTAIFKRIEVADDDGVLLAREEALREVRRLTDMMKSDNRVHLLSRVPFDGISSPFPEIGAALWDIETNLMTSG